MKKIILLISVFLFFDFSLKGQSCEELMKNVKSQSSGITYYSLDSDAISKVTFYELSIDYKTYYFAIVCFKNQVYDCTEYIYLVSSNTKLNYALNYTNSAGNAFWKYINPFKNNLDCSPNL